MGKRPQLTDRVSSDRHQKSQDNYYDVLLEVLDNIDPSDVRTEYIAALVLIDYDGMESVVTDDELHHALAADNFNAFAEARVIFDVRKMRCDMIRYTEAIFDEVYRRQI